MDDEKIRERTDQRKEETRKQRKIRGREIEGGTNGKEKKEDRKTPRNNC